MTWRDDAACKGRTHLFYPERGLTAHAAKAICAGCPVQVECRAAGAREPFGVWGGTSVDDRTARSIPDTAACVGSVKAAIDGLVDAGVLTDDTPDIVRTVTFHAPVVDRERHSDALTLWIAEYVPAWSPEKEPF